MIEAGFGPCYVHNGTFAFDPDLVNVVLVDPVTNKPPDVDPDPETPDEAARVRRSVRRPVCVNCCRTANKLAGAELFVIRDKWQEAGS